MAAGGAKDERKAPLISGVRVLELTDEKGLYCGKLLAQLGADVIKLERPGGDSTRDIGPFFQDGSHPERSLSFWYYNTGKRGITLNLEAPQGQELFKKLVTTADILVEAFPPGHLERVSLGYEALKELHPGLIMVSITPFGQEGPYKDYKGSELVTSAMGGQVYICGEAETPPLNPFGLQAYHLASYFGAVGALVALFYRNMVGLGQHIDVSVQASVAAALDHVNVKYSYEREVSRRQGSLHWSGGFRVFPCQDGYILLSTFYQWDLLVQLMARDAMAADLGDKRWHDPEVRRRELPHIIQVIEEWTRTQRAAKLMEMGQELRFPWGMVNPLDALLDNPQLAARGFFVEVDHPDQGQAFKYPGSPCRLNNASLEPLQRAPFVGEHNKEVYGELGLSQAELAGLTSQGII